MATVALRADFSGDDDPLVYGASSLGFELATRETDTGQLVWEWRNGDGPHRQFVSERLDRDWMAERIARSRRPGDDSRSDGH